MTLMRSQSGFSSSLLRICETSMTCPITILAATHGRPDLLQRTFGYLAQCEIPSEYDGIIIIENGGRFGAEQVVEQADPRLKARYIFEQKGNKSRALNIALKLVEGAALFIDDDVRVNPDFLTLYAEAVRSSPPRTFLGGPVEVDYEEAPPDWLRQYLPFSAVGWRPTEAQLQAKDYYFLGANWLAFVDDLRACGGFAEWIGPGTAQRGQESYMQMLLIEAGLRPEYLPQPVVWHYVPRSNCTPQWALERATRHARGAGAFYNDNCPRILGVPRWMYLEIVKRRLKVAWSKLFESDPATRHFIAHEYSHLLGLMQGIRTRRELSQPTSSVPTSRKS